MNKKRCPDLGCGWLTVVFILGVIVGSSRLPEFLHALAAFLEP